MAEIKLTIDGRQVTADENKSILEAALENGIYIPHLCYHEDLSPNGGCRLCVVEVEGVEGVVTSCSEKVKEGMVVSTKGELAEKIRKLSCDFMFKTHPSECTGCPKYGKCQLASISQYIGDTGRELREIKIRVAADETNPLMLHEMYRCILCGRCVRACGDLRGVSALKFAKVDGRMQVVIDGSTLKEAECRFCGACVEVCPTGSIRDKVGVFREDLPRDIALVPCQAECPAHIDIPAYLRAVNEGDCDKAVGIIREKVPFPHALGLVCNNRCENEGCKRRDLNGAVSIRNIKRYAAEHDETQSWKEQYLKVADRSGKKVAVIGGGAAGLTAGYYLNKKGHDVTVFESKSIPGGHMTSGMPEYRIPTQAVLDEIKIIEDSGVKIECDHPVNSINEVKNDFDAVLVAIGTSVGKKLGYLPGADLPQVYSALEILQAQRLNKEIDLGDTVNIIGGGNVAFDVAGTCIRMGKTVNVVCLEKDASQASPEERDAALEEGANLFDSHSNEAILGDGGKVTGLQVHKINSFHFDPETRALVEDPVPDSTYTIPCDSIVFAAGQVTGLTDEFGLELNDFGYPIDPATGKSGYKTSVDGVFTAGDVITGTRFLIDAIAGGRDVAEIMDKYLGGDGMIDECIVERKASPWIGRIEGFGDIERREMSERDAAERKADFAPITEGFTCDQASCETDRCLQCDLRLQIAPQKFWNDYTGEAAEPAVLKGGEQ